MKLRRREAEVFSLSFMDCICCGFGAIILLLVLTESGQPVVIEKARAALNGQLLRLQEELHVIRGDSDQLNRELRGRIADLEAERMRMARLQGDLTNVRGRYVASNSEAAVTNRVETELVSAYQELTAEMERLLRQPREQSAPEPAAGGVPVDSEYVVFVIDTSDSMASNHWESTHLVMTEILDVYPRLKGLQVINDQGRYMFEDEPGWLQDSAGMRQRIRDRLPGWKVFSASNPVPGIELALRKYRAAGRRVAVVVIGDEFTGSSLQKAMDGIAAANAPDGARPRARIHAIGFPEGPEYASFSNQHFWALMRVVTAAHGGTFVGITNEKPCQEYSEVLGNTRCTKR